MALDLEAARRIKAAKVFAERDTDALIARVEELEAQNNMLLGARRDPADVQRIKDLEAAIRAYCDPPMCTYCNTNCPLYPFRGGE